MVNSMKKPSQNQDTSNDVAESSRQVRGFRFFKIPNKSIKSEKLHFRVTKKDMDLLFHFHILNFFWRQSKWGFLVFDQTFK